MEENKLPSSDDLFTETQVDISSLIDIVPMGSPDIILTIFAQRVDNLNYISSALRSFPDIVSYIDRNPYLEARLVFNGKRNFDRFVSSLKNCLTPHGGGIQLNVYLGSVLNSGWLIDIKPCYSQQITASHPLAYKKLLQVLENNL